MKVIVRENNSSGTSSLLMVTDCLEELFSGIIIAVSVCEKITWEEQSPLIRRQVIRRNYSEKITEKQNSVKTPTESPKTEHLPYMEIVVASTKKWKVVHIKPVWIG